MTNEELLDEIRALGGYRDIKLLEDGSIVGIGDLMFTRAIYMDMNPTGWGRRFCFEDRTLADTEYAKITSEDTEPVGWIARR
jgi:hypothetical protein